MTDSTIPILTRTSLFAMLLAVFAVSAGYGIVLPILPFLIDQFADQNGSASIGSHTGLLMGIYVLAVFLFAPLWGAISDRRGRKPVMLAGLSGFAVTVFVLAKAESLPVLYVGRFLSGAFSAAITPAAFALIGDHAPDLAWRAHRFALVNIAGSLGFFIGPMIGGLAVRSSAAFADGTAETVPSAPFVAAAALATVAAAVALLSLPLATPSRTEDPPAETPNANKGAIYRLPAIAFATAYAVGSFEVGLSLQGKMLGLDAAHIGAMFAECSLVMAVVQAAIFSPLFKPGVTRWFIAPGLAVLLVGLAGFSLVETDSAMAVAIGLIAGSAGILSPIATYWASLGPAKHQGKNLGRMTASSSLGQAIGSAAAGLLFSGEGLSVGGFVLPVLVVTTAFLMSVHLPRILVAHTPERP